MRAKKCSIDLSQVAVYNIFDRNENEAVMD